jgi:hypothetical protein
VNESLALPSLLELSFEEEDAAINSTAPFPSSLVQTPDALQSSSINTSD